MERGLIGYFPTYSLGNIYAAQFFGQAESDLGNLVGSFAGGDFRPLFDWLRERVHRHGQRYSAAELVERATGRPPSAGPLVEHLSAKMGLLYELYAVCSRTLRSGALNARDFDLPSLPEAGDDPCGVDSTAEVRCPLCKAEYALGEPWRWRRPS